MSRTCPGCDSELHKPDRQNFCGSCGEPINATVDRERIRRNTEGFLDPREVKRIGDSVKGERGPHPEYTHVRAQEGLRHALHEIWLLSEWNEFDHSDAIRGELGRQGFDEDMPAEVLADLRGVLGLSRFLFCTISPPVVAQMYELALEHLLMEWEGMEEDDFEVPSIEIYMNGEPATQLLEV